MSMQLYILIRKNAVINEFVCSADGADILHDFIFIYSSFYLSFYHLFVIKLCWILSLLKFERAIF